MRLRNGKSVDETGEHAEQSLSSRLSGPNEDNQHTDTGDMPVTEGRASNEGHDRAHSASSPTVRSTPTPPSDVSQAASAAGLVAAAVNYTNGTKTPAASSMGNAITKDTRPHDKNMLFILKLGGSLLVVIYFLIPVIIKLNPWIMSEIVFLHRIRVPFFADLEKPAELGLNGTMNVRIPTTDDLSLGAWHILPESLHDRNVPSSREFTRLLQNDQDVVIYMHGNAGTRATKHRLALYKVFSKAGFHTIAVDYRGYGDSEGSPSEDGLVDDALAAFDWVKSRAGNSKVYFWGHSLGTGVATQAASRACQRGTLPDGVILEAPFTSVIDAAISHPLSTPFRYMPYFTWVFVESLKYNNIYFSNDKHIRLVTVPVLMLHAKDDNIVPFHLGQKLYEVARSKQTKGTVHFVGFEVDHRYGHDDIYKAADLMHIVRDFMTGRLRS